MNKDEMKNSSMALKDPILQQGFEIICKNLVDLEKENAELKEEVKNNEDLATVAYMQGAESQKKKVEDRLTKAKEIIENLLSSKTDFDERRFILWVWKEEVNQAEQFLKKVSE